MKPAARRTLLAVAAVGLVTAGLGFLTWHVADRIHREALLPSYDRRGRLTFDDDLVAGVDSTRITLIPRVDERGRLERAGSWGVVWNGGSGRVGAIERRDSVTGAIRVTRRFTPVRGLPRRGDLVDLRLDVYEGDPLRALGIPFREVTIPGPLGPMPAWEIPGARSTWVLYVHGKAASRAQGLRHLGPLIAAGFPVLLVTYRNDEGAPPSPDGRYHYGDTEWRDLEAAVHEAAARGARRVILYGTSMGGGLVMAFLERSASAGLVSGAVLDSPMLDFGATIDWGARRARIPGVGLPLPPAATALAKRLVSRRDGVDWRSLDLLADASRVHVPFLVFHGDRDTVVPPETSRDLARALPGRVTLVRFAGADHAEGWNVDPDRYDSALRAFLGRIDRTGADAGAAVERGARADTTAETSR